MTAAMSDADLAALNAAPVLRLFDRAGGMLLAQARLGAFKARDDGTALSELVAHVPADGEPGWAELVDADERVVFAGRVGAHGDDVDGEEVQALVEVFRAALNGDAP